MCGRCSLVFNLTIRPNESKIILSEFTEASTARGSSAARVRQYTVIAVLTALYLVLSLLFKIPVGGDIKLDLGYIVLMVSVIYLGAAPAAVIGGLGALLESILTSRKGIAPGWILMNVIVGLICGWVLYKRKDAPVKTLVIAACIVVPVSMLPAVTVKTLVDFALYPYTDVVALKIATAATALVTDSAVMLIFGLPLSVALRGRVKF